MFSTQPIEAGADKYPLSHTVESVDVGVNADCTFEDESQMLAYVSGSLQYTAVSIFCPIPSAAPPSGFLKCLKAPSIQTLKPRSLGEFQCKLWF